AEFQEIYKLDVIEIPTNKPLAREDDPDIIYKNENAKFRAVIEDIKESHSKGQPVLVGTVSIEKSEKLSRMLDKEGIKHTVLNAKQHEKEAEIVAQAGKFGAVTIATNMAGRGTDIMLGGNSEYLAKQEMKRLGYSDELIEQATAFNETDDEDIISARNKFKELENRFNEEIKDEKQKVIDAGGLKIIGTERHESRRIDNQLRGRSGRQGDPGISRFYIGLDDDLMKIFGGNAITKVYDTLGADENMPIQSRIISNAVENAQKKVEGRNFSIRKNVLNYDDVMNTQREIIYKQRREVLDGENIKESVMNMMDYTCEAIVSAFADDEMVNVDEALLLEIQTTLGLSKEVLGIEEGDRLNSQELIEKLKEAVHSKYEEKEQMVGYDELREVERIITLKVVDDQWMEHIDNMDELKNGIGLRAYGQKDPVVQYRIEGFDMFDEMVNSIKIDITKALLHLEKNDNVQREEAAQITDASLRDTAITLVDGDISEKEGGVNKTVVNKEPKVGRNDLCPCGSGKKYKNCCGKNQ
ncbi:MAG: SEC-C domain-containing protein, partial [Clostridia bacterium]|nr:SEC-C domain-containing protein [Clostridia bacterium]